MADDYTRYLQSTWKMAKQRNPTITVHEANSFAWSTWRGCGDDLGAAMLYNAIVAQETNFQHIDNVDGFGYSGALWEVVWRICRKDGYNPTKHWCRTHRFTVNRLLAKRFYALYIDYGPEEAVKRWHRGAYWKHSGKDRREALKYWRDINSILRGHDAHSLVFNGR